MNTKNERDAAMIERAKKFLDLQTYGNMIPETRLLWTAWLVGFAQKEIDGAARASRREVVEEAFRMTLTMRDRYPGMPLSTLLNSVQRALLADLEATDGK
jgi:hypothetical protein